MANKSFINNNKITYTNKAKLIKDLCIDKHYHFRIYNKQNYIYEFGNSYKGMKA